MFCVRAKISKEMRGLLATIFLENWKLPQQKLVIMIAVS